MTQFIIKKYKVQFVAIFTLTLIVPFAACSKKRVGGPAASQAQGPQIVKSTGIVVARQILSTIGSALNIDLKSETTPVRDLLLDYFNLSSSLPQYGDQGQGYTSAMSRLITNFMKRGCKIAYDRDNAITAMNDRQIFRFIDIKKNMSDPWNKDEAHWKAYAKHIAYRFWGEQPQDDELKVVTDFITQVTPNARGTMDTATVEDVAVLTCALVGSAPRSIFGAQQM